MSATVSLDGRELNRLIAEAVLAVLGDAAPEAMSTPEVQATFSPRNYQRVYNAMRKLERAGQMVKYHEIDRAWWSLPGQVCATCGAPARRVRWQQVLDGPNRYVPMAWYSCHSSPDCECNHAPRGWLGYRWPCDLRPPYDGPRI